jgi:hypothetical protein
MTARANSSVFQLSGVPANFPLAHGSHLPEKSPRKRPDHSLSAPAFFCFSLFSAIFGQGWKGSRTLG